MKFVKQIDEERETQEEGATCEKTLRPKKAWHVLWMSRMAGDEGMWRPGQDEPCVSCQYVYDDTVKEDSPKDT